MQFCNLKIKSKVTLLLMATSGMAVGFVCLMFYFMVSQSFKKDYSQDLHNLVDIVGHNCAAALTFNVPEDAEMMLSSLQNRPSILTVRLFDKDHRLFAAYDRNPPPADPMAVEDNQGPAPDTSLKIEQPIQLPDGTLVGSIIVHDDISGIGLSQKKWLLILTGAGIIALAAAFLLATFLQNIISRPLLALTAAVKRLAAGDFSAGPAPHIQSQDEIGILSTAFIDMSRQLADSYSKLEAYNQNLENRVAARTEELQRAMTDLTKSQDQLIQSEKMVAVGHLVAGVAHEINNSLNFITGALPAVAMLTKRLGDQLSSETAPTPVDLNKTLPILQKIETLLQNAEVGVQRTVKIVSDLNTFARPSHGQFTPTDLHRELEMVVTLLHYELRHRIEVSLDFCPTLPLISCLRDQFNQVSMNIIRNAIQAIPEKGTIWIKTWVDSEMANISFRDSGCGIPATDLAQIFNPFFSTKEVGQGTGLGLAISYGIMKNHHGQIMVNSTVGQGTTVTLRLPLRREGQPVSRPEAPLPPPMNSNHNG